MPASRYYNAAGKRLPGVTTVTGNLGWSKGGLMWWANQQGLAGVELRDAQGAATIGTLAHAAIEGDIAGKPVDLSSVDNTRPPKEDGEPDELSPREKVEAVLERWQEWKRLHVEEVFLSEHELVSEELQYGGRMDMLFRGSNGKLWMLDVKTGGMYADSLVQVAGYAMLVEENTDYRIDELAILRIPQESESITTHERPWKREGMEQETFRLCLRLHAIQKVLKKEV